ncbi:MAG TPA: LuxR C-terminal-related transcriptional regulator [Chloroflexota bacterium]|nr:LuxR C-terminal-related transcriptional regulator [Chloroflexota bacterium]
MARCTAKRGPAGKPEKPNARGLHLLAGIAEGYTNEELAAQTGHTVQTVKNCVSEMLHQLRVPNRSAAVTLALQEGWLDLSWLRVRRT